jgi:hypothetical protein
MEFDLTNSSTWTGNWSQLCPTCKVLRKTLHYYSHFCYFSLHAPPFCVPYYFSISRGDSTLCWKQKMKAYVYMCACHVTSCCFGYKPQQCFFY